MKKRAPTPSPDLETATERELEAIAATTTDPTERRKARAALLQRAQELARTAARDLTEATRRLTK